MVAALARSSMGSQAGRDRVVPAAAQGPRIFVGKLSKDTTEADVKVGKWNYEFRDGQIVSQQMSGTQGLYHSRAYDGQRDGRLLVGKLGKDSTEADVEVNMPKGS